MPRKQKNLEASDSKVTAARSSVERGQSLNDIYPDLASEWHPTLNLQAPSDVSTGSHKKVWWQCSISKDHVWEAKVQSRAKQKQGCPFCAGRRASAENNLLRWCESNGEFGALLNSQFSNELNSVTIDKLTYGSKVVVWWRCAECGSDFDSPVNTRTSMRTNCPYCSGHRVGSTNSLAFCHPALSAQWDEELNEALTPADVTPGSSKKVWWKCSIASDHRWQAAVVERTQQTLHDCPFCKGLKLSTTNSLATLRPDLAGEWDSELNGNTTPSEVSCSTGKKFWWRCSHRKEHSWEMSVNIRTKQNQGCPFCAGKRVDQTNSFESIFPHLAPLFDVDLNGCTPDSISKSSSKRYWWRCPNGPDHLWKAPATSVSRWKESAKSVAEKIGPCPFCPPQITRLSITNSLSAWCSQNGERGVQILSEWDEGANPGLSPQDVIYSRQRFPIHWKCQKANDHRWTSNAYDRTVDGYDCPFCSGRRPSSTNNLALLFPDLAARLHKTLNGSIDPSTLSPTTHETFWWQCPVADDHVWKASVNTMKGGLRCGFCAGKKASSSNSLALGFPEIADEFDLQKNSPLTPKDVTSGSGKRYWWRCSANPEHSWQAQASARTGKLKTGCPECVIAPRSRREIILSHEIGSFFQVDQLDHRIRANGKTFDCDIVLRNEQLVIEYDGSYWHKEKFEADNAKTQSLIDAGWKVIRIREEPLPLVQTHDVLCSEYEPVVGVAAKVLRTVSQLVGLHIVDLDEYESKLQARATDEAEKFIQDLLNSPDAVTAYRKRQSWDRRFHELEDFTASYQTSDPATIPGAPKTLITWVNKQRSQYETQALSSEFTLRLESLPGWHWSQVDFRWKRQYEKLLTSLENRMNLGSSSIGQTLNSWVVHQRQLFGLGQLSDEQKTLLQDLPNWSWAPVQDAWQKSYAALLDYVSRTGTSHVPQDHVEGEIGLGVWVKKQRGRHKRGVLEVERLTLLSSLPGWTWSPSDTREESTFDALHSFVSREGHAQVSVSHVEGEIKLGQWLANVRSRRRSGNLDPGVESRLSAISGFDWEPLESKASGNIKLLEEYLKANPDQTSVRDVVYKGRKLNSIVVYMRKQFKTGELHQEFVERLEALPNWSWSPHADFWRTGYSYLVKYVEREGTSLVPQIHEENDFQLGTWVNGQRTAYRKGSLQDKHITLLEELPGWTWKPARGPHRVQRRTTPHETF